MRAIRGMCLVGAAFVTASVSYADVAHAAPVVGITTPAAGATVTDTVAVQVAVADAFVVASVTASIDGISRGLGMSGASWVGSVNIAALPLGPVTLTVTAMNALGESTTVATPLEHVAPPPPPPPPGPPVVTCPAAVSPSPNLTLVSLLDGRILDVDATRILYVRTGGLSIKSRVDGTVTPIVELSTYPTYGRLFSNGATWPTGTWRAGVVTGRSSTATRFRATGDWATWQSADGATWRENLATASVNQISAATSFVFGIYGDAAGNVAYSNGASLPIGIHRVTTSGTDTVVGNGRGCIIDGDHVVFEGAGTVATLDRYPITLSTPAGSDVLDPFAGMSYGLGARAQADRDFRAVGGWVAYTKMVSSKLQAWTRSPSGTKALASPYLWPWLAGMNELGQVVVDSSSDGTVSGPRVRSISAAGAIIPTPPIALGSAVGEMRWVDGAWYEQLDCALYRVDPSAADPGGGGGGGAGDGGDAGGVDGGAGGVDGGADGGDGGAGGGGADASPDGDVASGGGETSSGGTGSAAGDAGAPPPSSSSGGSDTPPGSSGAPAADPSGDGGAGSASCTFAPATRGSAGSLLLVLAFALARARRRASSTPHA